MHPNTTFFAEVERNRPGSTLVPSVATLDPPQPIERVQQAIDRLARRHPVLTQRLEATKTHDPADTESWWSAYRLLDGASIDTRLVDRLPARPEPWLPDAGVRFEFVCRDDRVEHIRLSKSHGTFDGSSESLVWADLDALLRSVETPPAATSARTFADYMRSQEADWRQQRWVEAAEHWGSRLRCDQELALPADGQLSVWPLLKVRSLRLNGADHQDFLSIRRRLEVSPFALLAATVAVAVHRLLGWDRVPLITPAANRYQPGSTDVIGQFANPVALPIDEPRTLTGATRSASMAIVDVLMYGHYPFFLLQCEQATVRHYLEAAPVIAVRDASVGSGVASDLLTYVDEDLAGEGPAIDFGLGFDLMVDVAVGPSEVSYKFSYRGDRIGSRLIDELGAEISRILKEESNK